MIPIEFLKSTCKCDETCNINYKPYEYGSLVESIHIKKAEQMLKSDIKEMREFFLAFGVVDEKKVVAGVYDIWKKHLVIY